MGPHTIGKEKAQRLVRAGQVIQQGKYMIDKGGPWEEIWLTLPNLIASLFAKFRRVARSSDQMVFDIPKPIIKIARIVPNKRNRSTLSREEVATNSHSFLFELHYRAMLIPRPPITSLAAFLSSALILTTRVEPEPSLVLFVSVTALLYKTNTLFFRIL